MTKSIINNRFSFKLIKKNSPHSARKEHHILRNDGQLLAQLVGTDGGNVLPVHQNGALANLIDAKEGADERGLATASATADANLLARPYVNAGILDDRLKVGFIAN